jgi:hypothetical protein
VETVLLPLANLGFDGDTIGKLREAWASPRYVEFPDGDYLITKRGLFMGDGLTKAALSAVHPISLARAKEMAPGEYHARACGDDHVHITENRHLSEHFLESAEMCGVRISEDDTFITNDWATYCEEIFYIPPDRFHTVRTAVKTNRFDLLPYLDYPRIKVVISTRKSRDDFSDDPVGKIGYLGRQMSYFRGNTDYPTYHIFCLASLLQDVCLDTTHGALPAYIPRNIFGWGKPPLWGKVDNVKAYYDAAKPWFKHALSACIYAHRTGDLGLKSRTELWANARVDAVDQPSFDISEINLSYFDPYLLHSVEEKVPRAVVDTLLREKRIFTECEIMTYVLKLANLSAETEDNIKNQIHNLVKRFPFQDFDYSEEFFELWMNCPWELNIQFPKKIYSKEILHALRDLDPLAITIYDDIERQPREERVETPYEGDINQLEDYFHRALGSDEKIPPPDVSCIDSDQIILDLYSNSKGLLILVTDDYKLVRRLRTHGCVVAQVSTREWALAEANESGLFANMPPEYGEATLEVDGGSWNAFLDLTLPSGEPVARQEFTSDLPAPLRYTFQQMLEMEDQLYSLPADRALRMIRESVVQQFDSLLTRIVA